MNFFLSDLFVGDINHVWNRREYFFPFKKKTIVVVQYKCRNFHLYNTIIFMLLHPIDCLLIYLNLPSSTLAYVCDCNLLMACSSNCFVEKYFISFDKNFFRVVISSCFLIDIYNFYTAIIWLSIKQLVSGGELSRILRYLLSRKFINSLH